MYLFPFLLIHLHFLSDNLSDFRNMNIFFLPLDQLLNGIKWECFVCLFSVNKFFWSHDTSIIPILVSLYTYFNDPNFVGTGVALIWQIGTLSSSYEPLGSSTGYLVKLYHCHLFFWLVLVRIIEHCLYSHPSLFSRRHLTSSSFKK